MPELPEVQCFADALNASHKNATVEKIILRRGDIRFPLDEKNLKNVFSKGTHIEKFDRVGKQLVVQTERGKFFVSLGMSGYFTETDAKKPKLHEHITLVFSDRNALGFVDPRRFGFWKQVPPEFLADPLDATSLKGVFQSQKVKSSKRSVKDVLMDQNLIGGIGNIYALEALYLAGVHPQKMASKLKPAHWNDLAEHIPTILRKAIEMGGSTISTYRNLKGDEGSFQSIHRVYDREGESCLKMGCKGLVARIEQGGRSSWFCPRCQKRG